MGSFGALRAGSSRVKTETSTAAARLNAYLKGMAGEKALAEAAREVGWDVEELRARLTAASR